MTLQQRLQASPEYWTLRRVNLWLIENRFSDDWISTFIALNIYGSTFLELGSGYGGRGNFGMMHQQVYPRLAKQCGDSGTRWDQERERAEGKRMRRLIRDIVKGRNGPSVHPNGSLRVVGDGFEPGEQGRK
jgi:mitogen-activated protein kinase kinase kinase